MENLTEILFNMSDFDFNFTDDLYSLPNAFRITQAGLYGVVILLTVVGNSLVIKCSLSTKKRKKVSGLFVCSFAISNVTIALLCAPFIVVSDLLFYYWSFPHWLCPFISYVQLVVVTQRACSLVALTIHRHRSIVYPTAIKLTKRNGAIITLFLWLFSAIFGLPVLLQSKVMFFENISPDVYGICVEEWGSRHLRSAYTVAIFTIQYVIPMVILTVAHARVFTIVFRRKVPGEEYQARDKMLKRSKKKTLVFLVLVVVTYFILLLPLHMTTMVGDYMPSIYTRKYVHILWLFFQWLAFCDTCTYPFLILYKRRKKKNSFRSLFCGADNYKLRRISRQMFQNSGMMGTCFSFVTTMYTHTGNAR